MFLVDKKPQHAIEQTEVHMPKEVELGLLAELRSKIYCVYLYNLGNLHSKDQPMTIRKLELQAEIPSYLLTESPLCAQKDKHSFFSNHHFSSTIILAYDS